jgi:hypothetical protein
MAVGKPQKTLQTKSSINISDFFFAEVVENQTIKLMNPWKSKFSVDTKGNFLLDSKSNSSVILADSFPFKTACCPKQNKRCRLSFLTVQFLVFIMLFSPLL